MELEVLKTFSETGAVGIALLLVYLNHRERRDAKKEREMTLKFIEKKDEAFNLTINNHLKDDMKAKYQFKESLDDQKRVIESFMGTQKEVLKVIKKNNK